MYIMSITSLMCLFIKDFEQWKWIESIHLIRKFSAFFSFGKWEPVYLVFYSRIFYLMFCSFIWIPTSHRRLLLNFIHFASSNSFCQLLAFIGCTTHQSVTGIQSLGVTLCVFLFHIFYPVSHQTCKSLHSWLFFFFPI